MLRLIRLALRRFKSDDAYREMQAHIARSIIADLEDRGIDLSASEVLELPAGRGGYARVFKARVGRLTAADIHRSDVFDGDLADVEFVEADALRPLPLADSQFDLVHCASLVEHLPQIDTVIAEASRVLRPGGHLLLTFPPFWSLWMVGGHQYKPFHFLGERVAVAMAARRLGVDIASYADNYSGEGGLYIRTIAGVGRSIRSSGLDLVDVYPRLSKWNTAKLPGRLADLFTWHACFLARKANN